MLWCHLLLTLTFFSDEFEQAAVTHLSSVGGTPFFYYPDSTPHHAEGEVGGAPTHVPSGGGGGSGGGCHAASASRRGGLCCPSPRRLWGVDDAEEDGWSLPVAGGMFPSPLPLR
jgi:hypothetical protein